jgi:molybdopterin synthase catalytic subunit
METFIAIQAQDFDVAHETRVLQSLSPSVGAIVTFIGLVRDASEAGQVTRLVIEHYPGMAEKEIASIVAEAGKRWPLEAVRVIHRTGSLLPADNIVYAGVASRHRGDAFHACEFIMDFLKTRAPFWKKESRHDGDYWLEARQADREKSASWDSEAR